MKEFDDLVRTRNCKIPKMAVSRWDKAWDCHGTHTTPTSLPVLVLFYDTAKQMGDIVPKPMDIVDRE